MEMQHQATEENKRSGNRDCTVESILKDNSVFIVEKNEREKEINNKVDNIENKLAKPLLTFKWQKNSTKMKMDLQGSVAKAFSNFNQDDHIEKSRNRFVVFKNKLCDDESTVTADQNVKITCSYKEPIWSGMPSDIYKVDVFKAGVILKTLDLSYKSYNVIGTSLSCDIILSHKTVSEFHAVLQYRCIADFENETGIYIYDLNSTYGTFLNGVKIKPYTYIIVQGGELLSFGNGQRKYVLHTPKDSKEQEAQLSAIELQELQESELQEQRKIYIEQLSKQRELITMKQEESEGISWGIIDVDELSRSTVTSEYSESDNEVSYLDNPKKTLQDWFKWEGYDLEYQTVDEGFGRFSCCIDLTLDALGSTKKIQCTVNGDKMKAIDECILRACKFLDDYGFLQQAFKEKKSTFRNWEAADYYDSDEDNYLDRTGAIEKKRQKRMEMDGKLKTQEMRDILSEKYADVCKQITTLENSINLSKNNKDKKKDSDEDALDAFMTELNTSSLSKTEIKDVKLEIQNLHKAWNLLLNSINVNTITGANQSEPHLESITEKTKNGCRFR
ncbi:kanadaptin-like [Phymastichus coffea]|uniref:kanadaptin-like n=1 Tax=Phymastichus coffea TaxID=108790 RepID=UPI00273BF866|nr:kanadaptin-like [Phymastichus coffea]